MQVKVAEGCRGWRFLRKRNSIEHRDNEASIQVQANTVLPENPKPVDDPAVALSCDGCNWIGFICKNAMSI